MALADPQSHRWTVTEYHHMGEVGLLHPRSRVELIEGEIVDMSPIGRLHAAVVNRIQFHLSEALGRRALVQTQGSVTLSDRTEPEPDVAVLAWRDDFYRSQDRTPDDIVLLVEVGDSSAVYDREVKLPLYAAAGVHEVWLVDLTAWTLLVATEPTPEGYSRPRTLTVDESVTVLDAELAVADLLGPPPVERQPRGQR